MKKSTFCLKSIIAETKRIVIIMHARPDGDALGASLGLAKLLKKVRHQVAVISPTIYPAFLDWLPGTDSLIIAEDEQEAKMGRLFSEAELIFCVDFSTLSRINGLAKWVHNATATKVIIDHHPDLEPFADILFWDTKAAASAELVYQLIEKLDEKALIDEDIANCLYTGIVTDTNSFKNPNTTSSTLRVAASLIELGANPSNVNRLIYDNNSLDRLQFISFAISQRLVVLPEQHTAYFVIQKEDYKRYHLQSGDTEGLVNYALSLQGVFFAALLKEKEGLVHLSLRSISDFAVNTFAKKNFNGGGHKNAAGGISALTLAETVDKFEQLVKNSKVHF